MLNNWWSVIWLHPLYSTSSHSTVHRVSFKPSTEQVLQSLTEQLVLQQNEAKSGSQVMFYLQENCVCVCVYRCV